MLKLVSGPAAEPVTTTLMKSWLRVSSSADDTLIDSLVKAAREKVENYTGRKLITQTWQLWLDSIPGQCGGPWWDGVRQGSIQDVFGSPAEISLEIAPVSTISSFTSYGLDNSATVFSSSNYTLDSASSPSRLLLNYGSTWPVDLRPANAICIEFVVGYGSAATAVPESLITAVKTLVAHYYEHRGDEEPMVLPASARALMDPYRIMRLR